MGLQYRKRGKKTAAGWFNYSASSRGIGGSFSWTPFGKLVTFNSRGRKTLNLGNGFRYVSYGKGCRKKTNQESSFTVLVKWLAFFIVFCAGVEFFADALR